MQPSDNAVFESFLPTLKAVARGKVRDIYEVDADHLLIVTTDRLSAYDVVLPEPIPGKGFVLTQLSNFWFAKMAAVVPNHLTAISLADVITDSAIREPLDGRAIIVKRLQPLPIEAVVRGYLIGSGWRDYCDSGEVCGHVLPKGLPQAAELAKPLFTPATKAAVGDHDENIDFATTCDLIGSELARQVRDISIELYQRANAYAAGRGIIVADTKFEFGLDTDGRLYVIDEMLTPDSSRFWPAGEYRTGISPPSYDKQFVRDYLDTLDWNRTAPGPSLPLDVRERTAAKYRDVLQLLTAN